MLQLDIDITPHLSSEYINYLENPIELINEAEKAAGENIWSLMQFAEHLRRQYGKEPRSMEVCVRHTQFRLLHMLPVTCDLIAFVIVFPCLDTFEEALCETNGSRPWHQ